MYLETFRTMHGMRRRQTETFLHACGLDWDEGIDFTCILIEDDEIIACGSLDGATIKCIAVSPMHQGEDLASRIITELRREAFERGMTHLMLFTKPKNELRFLPLGFSTVMKTDDVLLMETERNGLANYIAALQSETRKCGYDPAQPSGAIVANCNPITNGHLYLIQTAAQSCDLLHLFVLSEDKSAVPADVRLQLVRQACAPIKNICIHPTSRYLISSATFPSYFLPDAAAAERAYCDLDIRIFAEKIAPALNIRKRYVGTEPFSRTTASYNKQLKARLPESGIELIEVPRKEHEEGAISASRVRALWRNNDLDSIRPLVPDCTFRYIQENPIGL